VEHPCYGVISTETIEKTLSPDIWRRGVKTASRPFAFGWAIALLSPGAQKRGAYFRDPGGVDRDLVDREQVNLVDLVTGCMFVFGTADVLAKAMRQAVVNKLGV
jgi:hypothetical protein